VRAPDDVRRVIETWVRSEVACRISLDVRVISTDGGLYLLARESTGLLHERLVPDAQAAGVLVASWVANDSIQPAPSPPSTAPPSAPHAAPTPPARPTIDTVLVYDSSQQGAAPRLPSRSWWSLGATFRNNEVSGGRLHGGVDLLRDQRVAAGILLGGAIAQHANSMLYYRSDVHALVGLSGTYRRGPWQLRAQVGAGGMWSYVFGSNDTVDGFGYYSSSGSGSWIGVALAASVRLGFQLTEKWSAGIAPMATWYGSAQVETGGTGRTPDKAEFGVVLDVAWGL
jgi:hypothetical protein